jgi:putative GTP pyrophosphokinase
MKNRFDDIVQWFDRESYGLDAVENGLRNTIMDGLRSTLGEDYSWESASKRLGIYTVKGRVKGRERFREKLDGALCSEGKPLTFGNFTDFIPDLIGVRVICLHLDDLFDVAQAIRALMAQPEVFEPPPPHSKFRPCRVRRGQLSALDPTPFQNSGYHVDDPHPAGYSSIHFISRLGPRFHDTIDREGGIRDSYKELCKGLDHRRCIVEVQLRTLLEEAWGEVDHAIRYESKTLSADEDMTGHMAALASYLQAGNYHISLIRDVAKRKADAGNALAV